jgi:hypothetical protein
LDNNQPNETDRRSERDEPLHALAADLRNAMASVPHARRAHLEHATGETFLTLGIEGTRQELLVAEQDAIALLERIRGHHRWQLVDLLVVPLALLPVIAPAGTEVMEFG